MKQKVKIVSPLSVFHNHFGEILDIDENKLYPVHVSFEKPLKIYGVLTKESMFKIEEVEVLNA